MYYTWFDYVSLEKYGAGKKHWLRVKTEVETSGISIIDVEVKKIFRCKKLFNHDIIKYRHIPVDRLSRPKIWRLEELTLYNLEQDLDSVE